MSPSFGRRNGRAWVVSVFTMFVLLGSAWTSWLSRFPTIRDDLDFSLMQMSFLALCPAVGALFGLLTAGRSVGALGSRTALMLWLPVTAIALPLAVGILLSGHMAIAVLFLLVFGFAFGTVDVAANVNGATSERVLGRSRMALFHGGFSIGGIVALGIGAFAESTRLDTVLHLGVVSVVILVAGSVSLRYVREEPVKPARLMGTVPTAAVAACSPWRDSRIVFVGVVALVGTLAEGVAGGWLPLALIDDYGVENETGVMVLSLFYLGQLLTRLIGDRFLERCGRVPVLRATLGIAIVGVLLVVLSPTVLPAAVGALLWGIGAGLALPIGMTTATDQSSTAPQAVAAVSVIAYAAYVAGPAGFGFLGELFTLRAAFLFLVLFLVVGLLLSRVAAERPPEGFE